MATPVPVALQAEAAKPTFEERLARARQEARNIERFTYRLVSDAEAPGETEEARRLMALAIGLRRKLDAWRTNGE